MKRVLKAAILCLLCAAFCVGIVMYVQRPADPNPAETSTAPASLPVTVFDDSVKNVGIYLTEPSEIESLEVRPDILAWFESWGDPPLQTKSEICIRDQITPLISWQPHDYKLTDISAGKYDDYIRDYLTEMNELYGDNTVLIRLAHEMESYTPDGNTWYSWQYFGGEQDYIAMWRHVVKIGREVAPNIRWIWSPNRINEKSALWYPGDEYVDYVSITLNHESDQKPTYTNFKDYYFEKGRAECFELFDKKVLLSEIAYASDDEKVRGEYLKSVFDWVEQDDRICGVVFWNNNTSEDRMYHFFDSEYLMDIWYDGVRRLHGGN